MCLPSRVLPQIFATTYFHRYKFFLLSRDRRTFQSSFTFVFNDENYFLRCQATESMKRFQ